MAVITRYIVERDGEEKMTFANKKDADAYDKELDIAEAFGSFLEKSEVEVNEDTIEALSLYIAKYRDEAQQLLKGAAPKKKEVATKDEQSEEGKQAQPKKSKAAKLKEVEAAEESVADEKEGSEDVAA